MDLLDKLDSCIIHVEIYLQILDLLLPVLAFLQKLGQEHF